MPLHSERLGLVGYPTRGRFYRADKPWQTSSVRWKKGRGNDAAGNIKRRSEARCCRVAFTQEHDPALKACFLAFPSLPRKRSNSPGASLVNVSGDCKPGLSRRLSSPWGRKAIATGWRGLFPRGRTAHLPLGELTRPPADVKGQMRPSWRPMMPGLLLESWSDVPSVAAFSDCESDIVGPSWNDACQLASSASCVCRPTLPSHDLKVTVC